MDLSASVHRQLQRVLPFLYAPVYGFSLATLPSSTSTSTSTLAASASTSAVGSSSSSSLVSVTGKQTKVHKGG